MKITAKTGDVDKIPCDVLIVSMFEGKENNITKKLDNSLNKEISKSKKEFNGESGQLKLISTLGKLPAHNVLVVGLGKEHGLEQLRRTASASIKYARNLGAKKVVTTLHTFDVKEKKNISERVLALTEGTLLGAYQFNQFKTEDKDKVKYVDELIVLGNQQESINKGKILAEATMHVRDLVNLPANIVTPAYLAKEAEKLKKLGVKVNVYDKNEIKKLGFNAFLAVAGGSAKEPKFVVMEYGKGETYAFVGKGITFDSGGLELKTAKGMEDMKMDMGGAATVLGIMEAAAHLKMRNIHLVCVFPACENMPSGTSYRPGDVIQSYNGKNIEMMHTDAEGRMILSDALAYVEKTFKPKVMVDIATLTGAVISALGYWATGLFTTDDKLAEQFTKAGDETYDRVWRLPFWDEYKDNMKSDVADVRSIGKGYDAGSIEAGWFLRHFVDKVPWVHLDIAGSGWFNADKYYFSRGGTGAGVRLCVKWLETKLEQ